VETPAQYFSFALSPNGHDLAFSRVAKDGTTDLWVRDLARGSESRLAVGAYDAQWSPDGARLVYTAAEGGPPPRLFIKDVAGAHGPSELGKSPVPNFATGWSGDGRYIVSTRIGTTTGSDVWLQRMPNGDAERLPFNTPFNETDGKLSTDSRWIAYVTDGSGDDDVWIASFPAGETRRQVSTRGGKSPQWGANEREIFYVSREKELMSVSFRAEGGNVNIGTPRPLFHVPRVERGGSAGPGPAHALGVSGAAPAGAPLHGG